MKVINVTELDEGTWECKVKNQNQHLTNESKVFKMIVAKPPTYVKIGTNTNGNESNSFKIKYVFYNRYVCMGSFINDIMSVRDEAKRVILF